MAKISMHEFSQAASDEFSLLSEEERQNFFGQVDKADGKVDGYIEGNSQSLRNLAPLFAEYEKVYEKGHDIQRILAVDFLKARSPFRQTLFSKLFPAPKTAETLLAKYDLYPFHPLKQRMNDPCYSVVREMANEIIESGSSSREAKSLKATLKPEFENLSEIEKLKFVSALNHVEREMGLKILFIVFPSLQEKLNQFQPRMVQALQSSVWMKEFLGSRSLEEALTPDILRSLLYSSYWPASNLYKKVKGRLDYPAPLKQQEDLKQIRKILEPIRLEWIDQVFREIQKTVDDWKQGAQTTFQARLSLGAWLTYLRSPSFGSSPYSRSGDEDPLLQKARVLLPQLYQKAPVLFDSDLDGYPDQIMPDEKGKIPQDAFPMHPGFALDENRNEVPDELEESQKGPESFYGLQEGEIRVGPSLFQSDRLTLHRIQNRLFLVLNQSFWATHSHLNQRIPFYRYSANGNIEAYLRKMLPSSVGPLTLLINFYEPLSGEGKQEGIQLLPGSQLSREIEAKMGRWPVEASLNTLVHETLHNFLLQDRYPKSPYFQGCQDFNPGMLTLWNRPHVMNESNTSLHLDPIDLIAVTTHIAEGGVSVEKSILATGEIWYRQGEFEQAIRAYSDYFDSLYRELPIPFAHFFAKEASPLEIRKEVALVEALRKITLCQLKLYSKQPDSSTLLNIQQNLLKLETMGRTEWKRSPDAQEALMDSKILRGLLALAQKDPQEAEKLFQEARSIDRFNQGEFALRKITDLTHISLESISKEVPRKTIGYWRGGLGFNSSFPHSENPASFLFSIPLSVQFPVYSGVAFDFQLGGALTVLTDFAQGGIIPTAQAKGDWKISQTFSMGLGVAVGGLFGSWGARPYVGGEVSASIRVNPQGSLFGALQGGSGFQPSNTFLGMVFGLQGDIPEPISSFRRKLIRRLVGFTE